MNIHFTNLQRFLIKEAGISLRDNQEYQMDRRLGPLLEPNGCRDVSMLLQKAGFNRDLKQEIIEIFTTNETSFFRDIKVFNHFAKVLFPQLIEENRDRKQLYILSAAASSGQEAYSLAITLYDNFPEIHDWKIIIQGLDIDNKMVEKATEGWYTQLEVNRGLPTRKLFKHFTREGRGYRVKDHLKKMVRFKQANLFALEREVIRYHLILCRNVLIYFEPPDQEKVLTTLAKKLRPKALLFLGASEIGRMIPQKYLQHQKEGNVIWYQATN